MKGLFLDDERHPEDVYWVQYPTDIQWVIARTFEQFCEMLASDKYSVISFDHDLMDWDNQGNEYTGKHCLQFLMNSLTDAQEVRVTELPTCYFHSMNIIGRDNMKHHWNNFVTYVERSNE